MKREMENVTGSDSTVPVEPAADVSNAFNVARIMVATIRLSANTVLFCVFGLFPVFNVPSNHFILSLAINDVISLLYDLTVITIHLVSPDLNAQMPCFVANIGINFVAINLSQLAVIAVERFLFIRRPLHYYRLITQWKNTLILSSWSVISFSSNDIPSIILTANHLICLIKDQYI